MCVFRGGGEECLLSVRRGRKDILQVTDGREKEKTRADQTLITVSNKDLSRQEVKQDQVTLILWSSLLLAETLRWHAHKAGVGRQKVKKKVKKEKIVKLKVKLVK